MGNQNLWDISLGEQIATPNYLLEKQAEFLQEITQNRLEGKVLVRENVSDSSELFDSLNDGQLFKLIFKIYVPTLNNFSFTLIEIEHNIIEPYPCNMYSPLLGKKFKNVGEQEFESTLKEIFTDSKTRKTLHNLLSMVS